MDLKAGNIVGTGQEVWKYNIYSKLEIIDRKAGNSTEIGQEGRKYR